MKNKIFIIIAAVLVGIFLSYSYAHLVVSNPEEKFREFRGLVYLDETIAKKSPILHKDAYLLRVKHIYQDNQGKEFLVNGSHVSPKVFPFTIRRGMMEISYIHLQNQVILEGKNDIVVKFLANQPKDLDILLTNYRKQINNDIYILFSDSSFLPKGKTSPGEMVFFIAIIFLIFAIIIYYISKILLISSNKLLLYQLYSFMPFFFLLLSLLVNFHFNKTYKVVMTLNYFLKFGIISFFLIECGLIFKQFWYEYIKRDVLKVQLRSQAKLIFGAIEWFIQRELCIKFIAISMLLIFLCPFFLILDFEPFAEYLADIAYFALTVGVVIKFIKYYKRNSSKYG